MFSQNSYFVDVIAPPGSLKAPFGTGLSGLSPSLTPNDGCIALDIPTGTLYYAGGNVWKPVSSGGGSGGIYDAIAPTLASDNNGVIIDNVLNQIHMEFADATHNGIVSTVAQTFGGTKTFSAIVAPGTNYTTLAPITATDNNGITIDNALKQIVLEMADITHNGIVSTATQIFGGSKSFANGIRTNSIDSYTASPLVIGGIAPFPTVINFSSNDISNFRGGVLDIVSIGNNMGLSGAGSVFIGQSSGNVNTAAGTIAIGNLAGSLNTINTIVAIGSGALQRSTGDSNTAVGYNSLNQATTGPSNTAYGYESLSSLTTAFGCCAFGTRALASATIRTGLSAFGAYSLENNTTGLNNTAVGFETLNANITGSRNTVCGYQAGSANLGSDNTALGNLALTDNTTGAFNVALGSSALERNTTVSGLVAIGGTSLLSNLTGARLTACGYQSLRENVSGNDNSAFGHRSLFSCTTANRCTAFGAFCMEGVTNNTDCCAFGYNALNGPIDIGEITAFGNYASSSNDYGTENTSVGFKSQWLNTSGSKNTSVGHSSLITCFGGNNHTAIGFNTLSVNLTGKDDCTAVGCRAASVTTIGGVTAVGSDALRLNTTGVNMGIGTHALFINTTGTLNTAVGNQTLINIDTGNDNIALGNLAGSSLTLSDSKNILIGHTGIAGNNQIIRIGDTTAVTGHLKNFQAGIRNVTTDTADAIAVLIDSSGQLGTISSTRTKKDNITNMDDFSSGILNLQPRTFTWKDKPQNGTQGGLIAEEVLEVMPYLVAYGLDGQLDSVKYHEIPTLLLNEVIKLKKRVDDQQQYIDRFNGFLAKMEL